jgi:hypothetical protein
MSPLKKYMLPAQKAQAGGVLCASITDFLIKRIKKPLPALKQTRAAKKPLSRLNKVWVNGSLTTSEHDLHIMQPVLINRQDRIILVAVVAFKHCGLCGANGGCCLPTKRAGIKKEHFHPHGGNRL